MYFQYRVHNILLWRRIFNIITERIFETNIRSSISLFNFSDSIVISWLVYTEVVKLCVYGFARNAFKISGELRCISIPVFNCCGVLMLP